MELGKELWQNGGKRLENMYESHVTSHYKNDVISIEILKALRTNDSFAKYVSILITVIHSGRTLHSLIEAKVQGFVLPLICEMAKLVSVGVCLAMCMN